MRYHSLIFAFFSFCTMELHAQCFPTQTYTNPGTYNYTIPGTAADTYEVEITTRGADGGDFLWGGNPPSAGGAGATMSATYDLKGGDQFFIIVGQSGFDALGSPGGGGGGGGSAVVLNSTDVLIAAAAGGGGGQNTLGEGAFASTNSPAQGGAGPGASGGGGFNAAGMTGAAGSGGGAGTLTSQGLGGTQGVVAGPGGNGFGGGGGGSGTGGGGGGGYKGGDGAAAGSLNGKGGDSFITSLFNATILTTSAGNTGGGFNIHGNVSIVCNTSGSGGGPPTLTLVSQSNPTCFGLADGTITVMASGGSGGFTYSINGGPATTDPNFTGLAAGNYTIVVTDSSGGMATVMATLTDPTMLSINILLQVDNLCFEDTNGILQIEGIGGTAPYMYQINGAPPQGNGIFTNLPTASYTLTVIDANGCTSTTMLSVGGAPQIVITIFNTTDVSCNGLSDGMVSFTASGGNNSFSFSIDGVNFVQANSFSDLPAGMYTLTAKDGNNCQSTTSFTISEPSAISLMGTAQDISCFGASDGVISLVATGGNPSYEYSIDGVNFQTSEIFDQLPSGTFIVTVRDFNLCTNTLILNIAEPELLVLDFTTANVTCAGAANGTVTLTTTGGTPPYEYSDDNIVYQSSANYGSLAPGNYDFYTRDANGCIASNNFSIIDGAPLDLVVDQVTDGSCGNADGSVNLSVSNGTAPYTYTLGTESNTTGIFNNLVAGSYTATVLDAINCSGSVSFDISQGSTISLTLEQIEMINCNGLSNATIQATATGGTGNVMYSLDGGMPQSSATFSNLSAGMYTVTVVDEMNCSFAQSITISEPDPISTDVFTLESVSCYGGSDGTVGISTSGGTGNFNITVNSITLTGSAGDTLQFTDLTAGMINFDIIDANGCSTTANLNLAEPAELILSEDNNIAANCDQGINGMVSLSANGGTAPYVFTLSGSNATGIFPDVIAGNYTASVTDANGCEATLDISVDQIGGLSIFDTTIVNVSCFGLEDGFVQLIVTGGSGNYMYTLGNQSNNLGNFSNLGVDDYTILIEDSQGCQSQYAFSITEPDMLGMDLITGPGLISVIGTGGTPDYSYSIDGVNFQSDGTFSNLPIGMYTVTVMDANGCTFELNVNLTISSTIATDPGIEQILIGPNPSQSFINIAIELRETRSLNLQLYDLQGALIINRNTGEITANQKSFTLDISQFSAGTYLLKIQSDLGSYSQKIIKIN